MPSQVGMAPALITRPLVGLIGPPTAMPTPRMVSRRHAELGIGLARPAACMIADRVFRRIVCFDLDRLVGEHGVRDVGDDQLHVLEAEQQADAGAGQRVQRHRHGRPPDAPLRPVSAAVPSTTTPDLRSSVERHRDGRFRQAEDVGDLRSAERATLAENAHDATGRRRRRRIPRAGNLVPICTFYAGLMPS